MEADIADVDASRLLVATDSCGREDDGGSECSLGSPSPAAQTNDESDIFVCQSLSLQYEPIPESKSAVFRNPHLSAMEKRLMMRCLMLLSHLEDGDQTAIGDTRFCSTSSAYTLPSSRGGNLRAMLWDDLLAGYQLTPRLRRRLTCGLCLKPSIDDSPETVKMLKASARAWSATDALARIKCYVSSYGRYGHGEASYCKLQTF